MPNVKEMAQRETGKRIQDAHFRLKDLETKEYPAASSLVLLAGGQTIVAVETFTNGIKLGAGTDAITVYDEGTWTPAVTGGGSNPTVTYTTQTGIYWRINGLVFFHIVITINTYSGGTGAMRISLPFTANGAGYHAVVLTDGVDIPGTPIHFTFTPITGNAYGSLITTEDNAAAVVMTTAVLAAGDTIAVNGFYAV